MEHPYKEFEGLKEWQSLDVALTELETNQDIKLTTAREYVIGYLCKRLIEDRAGGENSN